MEQQHLLCSLEEIIGNQYLYQLNKDQAMQWFLRALKSVENLIDDVLLEAGDIRKLQETKGKIQTYSINHHLIDHFLSVINRSI